MSQTMQGMSTTTPTGDRLEVYSDVEEGRGWRFFAGTILGLAGLMRFIDGIWALRFHGAVPQGLKDGVLGSNLKTYGWTWLAVGVILVVSSFLVLRRSQFARWIGMIAAGIGTLAAMTWMPYYPAWSITYVALGVLTIYALAMYGGRETS